ncbi:MAG: DNA replication and repair protein RecF [Bacteroidetes bacterium]|nr:DNA replication and repair protein RecF [Bacteroidota bacterium]
MQIRRLHIRNFRSHDSLELKFSKNIICITGNNGCGKTTVLDAIYYLCLCKSYFNPTDHQIIKIGQDRFRLTGEISKNKSTYDIDCLVELGKQKVFKIDNAKYDKLSEHIGKFPLVIVAPIDHYLISGSSEERRKFIDGIIVQYDNEYLQDLLAYNRILSQRNALLKQFAREEKTDMVLIQTINEQLIPFGMAIHKKRKQFIKELQPVFNEYYDSITDKSEAVTLEYSSQLEESEFAELLINALDKDRILQRTTVGIHKDDLSFEIMSKPINRFGSQGQQKSFLLSLKLAQWAILNDKTGITPILLLDDLFDKLDKKRIDAFVNIIQEKQFEQIFITDTDLARIENIMKNFKQDFQSIALN